MRARTARAGCDAAAAAGAVLGGAVAGAVGADSVRDLGQHAPRSILQGSQALQLQDQG